MGPVQLQQPVGGEVLPGEAPDGFEDHAEGFGIESGEALDGVAHGCGSGGEGADRGPAAPERIPYGHTGPNMENVPARPPERIEGGTRSPCGRKPYRRWGVA
ncbi:MAG: hypothetical protein AMXMBFR53_13590 [Gemmatimonadota bacterium]